MNKNLFYFLLISFFLITPLYAQEEFEEYIQSDENTLSDKNTLFEEKTQPEESIPYRAHKEFQKNNTPYTESFGNKFTLRLSAYISHLQFTQLYGNTEERYMPNTPLEIGFGFLYGNIGIELRQQTSFFYDSGYSKTQVQEGQFHYYAKNALFEIQIKDYKGFRTDSNQETDMRLQSMGIFGQYIWNSEEFSWRAAFGLYEKQLRSAGSFLLGGSAFYMTAESHFPESHKKRYILTSPNFGYAHTWVYKSNLFLALSPSIGIGMARELEKSKNYPAVSLLFHGAIGYHWDDVSFMISLKALATEIVLEDTKTNSFESTILQCTVAKRF